MNKIQKGTWVEIEQVVDNDSALHSDFHGYSPIRSWESLMLDPTKNKTIINCGHWSYRMNTDSMIQESGNNSLFVREICKMK